MKTVSIFIVVLVFVSAFAFAHENHTAAPGDAEIAHIVVTANAIDIDAGKMAVKKAKNNEVKDFAQMMITDHSGVNQQASSLAKKLSVVPKENHISSSLLKDAKGVMGKLKKLSGQEFDKEYMNREVAYHEAVLAAIDKTLIPNAKNAELKGLIEKVRPAIAAHLEHAKHIQASLLK